ncbi:uncharacterized protein LOC123291753 isoform X2 [Chrysoperla carnea]|uniref:uncharacterized protein LOC123291753 isoform X2 n=1 Tax=Chrysoperla carnea TaxID=189513 RepID=UPI001D064277|nr:uncharacterized protein LOC123291753 isoform X2 [Chrysoperla carnea]
MTAPLDIGMMDFLLQRDDLKDHGVLNNIKNEIDLDIPGFAYTNSEDNFNINDVWPSNPDEILDSILNDGGQLEGVLDPSPNSCSDSGLSSGENHDFEFEEQFHVGDDDEILSSTMSSPGPSISEAGIQSSPIYSTTYYEGESSPADLKADDTEMVYTTNETQNTTPIIIQPTNLSFKNTSQQQRTSFINNKSLQTVTILNQKNLPTKLSGKVIRVQAMPQSTTANGNGSSHHHPRSILLPVSVKDLRTIKIINTSSSNNKRNIKLTSANLLQHSKKISIKNNNIIFTQAEEPTSNDETIDMTTSTSDEDMFDGSNSDTSNVNIGNNNMMDVSQQGSYPRLQLTTEEQRLLAKEGISLPTSYPLTKHEERELKRIRRKIRNKISAQDSRKRKKEYVDGLEDRVKQCTEENQTLLKRIKVLQTQNQTLVSQLRRLQALVSRKIGGNHLNNSSSTQGASTAFNGSSAGALGGAGGLNNNKAQPATCLMVLLLSLALIAVPSLKRGDDSSTALSDVDHFENKVEEYIGKRALLFKPADEGIDDDLNMEDLITFHSENYSSSPSPSKKMRLEPHLPPLEELSLDGYPPTSPISSTQLDHDTANHIQQHEKYKDALWPLSSASSLVTGSSDDDVDNGSTLRHNASSKNNVVILHKHRLQIPEDQ